MRMETESRFSEAHALDAALVRLRKDLFDSDDLDVTVVDDGPVAIDYATLEFEIERMRKRLAVWEIFMASIREGARTWPEVQRSLTRDDVDAIVSICDGTPLRDLLLDME